MASNIIKPKLLKTLSTSNLSQIPFNQLFRCLSTSAITCNMGVFVPQELTPEAQFHRMLKHDETNEVSLQIITQSQHPMQSEQRLVDTMTLKVRSNDEAVLESYTQFVQRAANIFEMNTSGKIVLPVYIDKRTVNRSTHGNRLHRYQYEYRTHGRGIKISQVTGDTTDLFLEYIQRMKPEGVSVSVETTELEPLPKFMLQPPAMEDLADVEAGESKEKAQPDLM